MDKILDQVDWVPNTIEAFISSNGIFFENLNTGNDGLFWPAHSGKNAVFTAGPWLLGYGPGNILHSASVAYSSEFQQGPITTTYDGNPAHAAVDAANSGDSKWNIMSLSKSASPTDATYQEWVQNAAQTGAPLTADGKPLVLGDQVLYWVMNDLNIAGHSATSTTDPMGVEVHNYVFAFNQTGPLGQTIFMKFTYINKSTVEYDSCFVSWFSDIDLGDANDDLDGCDTVRSLGYTYNGNPTDAVYGSAPPADGYDFFEGPKIKTGIQADSAITSGVWVHGYKNLPMTSFVKFINGNATYVDPDYGHQDYPQEAYNLANGLISSTGQPFIDPTTGLPSKFVASGDPVTGKGWLDDTPADRRLVMSSGPFKLMPGDTQEIVVGFVIAQGTSAKNSITALKTVDDLAQLAFNIDFQLPSAPLAPKMAVGQLKNQLVLTWDASEESYAALDTLHPYNGKSTYYDFQGYNVYQVDGPSYSPTSSKAIRLATYDIVDSVTKIWDLISNSALGADIYEPVQFGTNSGIKHYYIVDQDALTGGPLVNGMPYYFAVTAYAYNPYGTPKTFETPIGGAVQTWIPNSVAGGTIVKGAVGDSIFSTNRFADDAVRMAVIDPDSLNGHSYRLTFDATRSNWSLLDLTTSAAATSFGVPVSGVSLNAALPIVDGFTIAFASQANGLRLDTQTPPGYSYSGKLWFGPPSVSNNYTTFNISGAGAFSWAAASGMVDALGSPWPAGGVVPDSLLTVKIIFSSTQGQKIYRYVDKYNPPLVKAKDSSFVPYLLNKGSNYPYQDYQMYPLGDQTKGLSAPFTVWTDDYVDHGRQLNVGLLENNDSLKDALGNFIYKGAVDGKWNPEPSPSGGGDILMIFRSTYSDSAKSQYTLANLHDALSSGSIDVMYLVWLSRDSTATFKNGDTLRLIPNYAFGPSHVYDLTAPKTIIGSDSIAKVTDAISQVQVFPNPYFAYNPLETNQFAHYVTFTHLPKICTIKVFSLNGVLIRTISHVDASGGNPTERWDLANSSGLPVASGMYIAYIDGGNVGTKILKLAIIQPQQRVNKL